MKKSILLRSALTTLAALALFAVVSGFLIGHYNSEAAKNELLRTTGVFEQMLAFGVPYETAVSYGTDIADLRVTVLSLNGDVLADSNADAESMENHAEREEVAAALAGKSKAVVRTSATTGIRMMYYARKIGGEGGPLVLRAAIPTSSINGYVLSSVAALLVITLAVLGVSVLVSRYAYRRVLQPLTLIKKGMRNINNGSYTEIVPHFKDSELNETLGEINAFSARIRAMLEENEREKEKLNYILNNMGQGLVVVDAEENVLLINRAAREIFCAAEDVSGKNVMFLTREPQLLRAVRKAIEDSVSTTFDEGGGEERRTYSVSVSALTSPWAGESRTAAVVTLRDVTEVREAEKARSEFFANASHELKTPLTSVKGFAELISNGMAGDKVKLAQYSSKIVEDSDRMLNLIDDMLKLSHLEEAERGARQEVDLAAAARSVAEGLSVQAEKKGVDLVLYAQPAVVSARSEHIAELLVNLVDNAIKYNARGGRVTVRTFVKEGRPVIAVEDTGIGIATEHHARIFERFYRVDKGRSRSAGGTGLGLAIVKHICALYHAEITLKSAPEVGTDIRITF